ncbi:MFS general substrate transporter [Eremomyces bilateralis CBS 781.70]|uniref:MFS general substrate transporter n=1 Tax=Eremomyces bilateralis CBS 781.70 TaxID=1392243 RepID=A0A6G1FQ78_9PEZI|nr:MFS general substrate transporter [Eremomyces bilateralis CBS 781.70]KAF1807985.1 MFS general substrate transporter [Eremomyces bilateralis CBS 781.70]
MRPSDAKEPKVTWRALPRKDQLLLLTLTRLSEPLTQSSLQSYMFYQLKSFDPSLPDSAISAQAGMMQSAFTAAQFLTAIAWGRAADSEYMGRKNVIMIGLLGTSISALGFGFSRHFATAVAFRLVGGALNGNVGVMRTMISEIIKERRYQSRAFMILPMTFNIGVIIGPVLGGLLADPINSYPQLFGPNSRFGGTDGVGWMRTWPYALPNIVSAMFLFTAVLCVILGLEETHEVRRQKRDRGLHFGRFLKRVITCRLGRAEHQYSSLPNTSSFISDAYEIEDVELQNNSSSHPDQGPGVTSKPPSKQRLPFSRIWTRNVITTLISHGIMAMHVGTFSNLWFVFLSTSRWDPAHPSPPSHTAQRFPVNFTGGLGLPPAKIGLALSILGFIGIVLQVSLYPYLSGTWGTVRTYRGSLFLFPLAYLVTPYLALIPSTTSPPNAASGIAIWAGIVAVLIVQVMARTFALPGGVILVNNSCPHPSVLGTLHGVAQSVSSATRTIGPIVGGLLLGLGLDIGKVGLAFWVLMGVAMVGACVGLFVKEGSGREIWLEGDDDGESKSESVR